MIAFADSLAMLRLTERPAWVRPLMALGAIVFLAKLTGAFDVPDSMVGVALAVEVVVIVFEIAVTVAVVRHFYGQHRESGLDRTEAWVQAEMDEMRAAGFPENLVQPFGRLLRFELRLYQRIARFFLRRPGRRS